MQEKHMALFKNELFSMLNFVLKYSTSPNIYLFNFSYYKFCELVCLKSPFLFYLVMNIFIFFPLVAKPISRKVWKIWIDASFSVGKLPNTRIRQSFKLPPPPLKLFEGPETSCPIEFKLWEGFRYRELSSGSLFILTIQKENFHCESWDQLGWVDCRWGE